MHKVLRRPDFRLLFLGVVASMVGESALLLVLAIWVKQLTDSNSLAGVTLFAVAAPAIFAPLLGWVVDRFRRRPFLVVANLVTVLALAPLLLVQERRDIWLVYLVAVCYGVSMLVVSAALNGLIKEILPADLLAEANGALQTVRQGLRLAGPIGGAALFTALGGRAVAALDMVCLFIGAVAVAALRTREERPARPQLRWLSEASAGIVHLVRDPALRRATAGLALAVLVMGFTETVVFAYVDEGLHRGPAFVSVFVCVQGIGGITGGLLSATVIRRLGEIGATALGVCAFAVGSLLLTYPNLVLAFVSAIAIGLGIPVSLVGFNTLMQRRTPNALLGRVSAAAETLITTPQAFSIVAGALLVLVLDYRLLFVIMGAVMILAAAYLWTGRALSPVTVTPVPGSAAPMADSAEPVADPAAPVATP